MRSILYKNVFVSDLLFAFCVKDIVMLQSALRGHLLRESQLKDLLNDTRRKVSHTHTHTKHFYVDSVSESCYTSESSYSNITTTLSTIRAAFCNYSSNLNITNMFQLHILTVLHYKGSCSPQNNVLFSVILLYNDVFSNAGHFLNSADFHSGLF